MRRLNILISGAGIAGLALAAELLRAGHAVTVVERAPRLRRGGQAIDFKGATHGEVLARMGILDAVHARRTGKRDMVVIDQRGRTRATIPGEFTGGDVEIVRGELVALLHERVAEHAHFRFGEEITALTESASAAHVTFAHGPSASYDLVVGADGMRSTVRRLAFGPDEQHVRHLGYYYAVAGSPTPTAGRARSWLINRPGRLASVDDDETSAMFVFASPPMDFRDRAHQRAVVGERFADFGGLVHPAVRELPHVEDFHLDALSRVELRRYARGRVVLVGDAGCGNALGGFGTGLAIVGAHVLAAELAAARGDHRQGFAAYERRMLPYAKIARRGNAGRFLAPRTRVGLWARDWTFRNPWSFRMMQRAADRFATDVELPDWPRSRTPNGLP